MTEAALPDRTAVILVNWNGWRDSIECLSSLYASEAIAQADVYLVDNDSADGSVERIAAWCAAPRADASHAAFTGVSHLDGGALPCRVLDADGRAAAPPAPGELTIVRSGANLGFAGGNNVGIVSAGLDRYRYFWLLNTDTVIRRDALARLVQRMSADPAMGMVGSTLVYYGQPDAIQAMGGGEIDARRLVTRHIGIGVPLRQLPDDAAALREIERRTAYVVGASMLVRSEFIRSVGPMCEDYFLYFEEVDWALRGRRSNFTLGYAPRSVVYHKVGASSEKVASTFSLRLFYRNRVRFIGRFFPQQKWPALADMAVDVLRHLRRGRLRHARLVADALLHSRALLRG